MFLKNVSNNINVVVLTTCGRISIQAQEVVKLNAKIVGPISPNLKIVTEQDYLDYKRGSNSTNNIPPAPDTEIDENDGIKLDGSNNTQTETKTNEEKTNEKTTNEEKTQTFIDSIISKGKAEQDISLNNKKSIKEQIKDKLTVKKTDSKTEVEKLQEQIDRLQQTWLEVKESKKKEKIQKDILKLQKQLKKIQK